MDSYSVHGCNFVVLMGRDELRVFLFPHLGLNVVSLLLFCEAFLWHLIFFFLDYFFLTVTSLWKPCWVNVRLLICQSLCHKFSLTLSNSCLLHTAEEVPVLSVLGLQFLWGSTLLFSLLLFCFDFNFGVYPVLCYLCVLCNLKFFSLVLNILIDISSEGVSSTHF